MNEPLWRALCAEMAKETWPVPTDVYLGADEAQVSFSADASHIRSRWLHLSFNGTTGYVGAHSFEDTFTVRQWEIETVQDLKSALEWLGELAATGESAP